MSEVASRESPAGVLLFSRLLPAFPQLLRFVFSHSSLNHFRVCWHARVHAPSPGGGGGCAARMGGRMLESASHCTAVFVNWLPSVMTSSWSHMESPQWDGSAQACKRHSLLVNSRSSRQREGSWRSNCRTWRLNVMQPEWQCLRQCSCDC